MTKVELFEAIRRDKFIQGKSVREIASKHGIHRRTVRQAFLDAVPPTRKAMGRESPVLTCALRMQADAWLQADAKAPRKQRYWCWRIVCADSLSFGEISDLQATGAPLLNACPLLVVESNRGAPPHSRAVRFPGPLSEPFESAEFGIKPEPMIRRC